MRSGCYLRFQSTDGNVNSKKWRYPCRHLIFDIENWLRRGGPQHKKLNRIEATAFKNATDVDVDANRRWIYDEIQFLQRPFEKVNGWWPGADKNTAWDWKIPTFIFPAVEFHLFTFRAVAFLTSSRALFEMGTVLNEIEANCWSELKELTNLWGFCNDSLFGAEVDVHSASTFVRSTDSYVFVTIFVYVAQVAQRYAEPFNNALTNSQSSIHQF